ncbi:MAG: nucleotidyltransferase family protein [Actinomycetota bacterium]
MSPIVDVVAGWGLADGVIDSVDPFEAARHLPLVAEHRLTGVAHAAMRAGDLEVDDPDRVADAHRDAMARSLLLEDVLLDAIDVLDRARIESRVLKGAALAHRDGDPDRREFGDNDLLVRPDQLRPAAAALEAAGAMRVFPPLSERWERRFAKSITLRWRQTELDLHRTLAPGPYGLTIDGDALFADRHSIVLAGVDLATLGADHHLIHAAVHVALGDVHPRLGNVRDTALLLSAPDLDADRVIATVVRWGIGAPFAAGVDAAAAIGAERTGVVEWAERFSPGRRDRRLMQSYRAREGRFRRQSLASLRVLGWRDRVAYVRAIRPSRAG